MTIKILRYVLYTLLLMLIETVICICLFEIELLFDDYKINSWLVHKAFRDGIEVNATRFIFYYFISFFAFTFFMNITKWRNRTLQASICNAVIYLVISVFYGLALNAFEYFSADFFYFLVIATLLSPAFMAMFRLEKKLI